MMDNNRKKKSTFLLFVSRIWEREMWMTITFFIAFLIILICNYAKAEWFREICDFAIDCFCANQTVIYTLCISYISGIIVYLLTVVGPETKRSKVVLEDLTFIFEELHSEFETLKMDLGISDTTKINDRLPNSIKQVTNRVSENHYNLSPIETILKKLSARCDELTSVILNHSSVLTYSEINKIVDVRNKKAMKRLKYEHAISGAFSECELCDYIKSLLSLDEDIVSIQKSVEKRIFR